MTRLRGPKPPRVEYVPPDLGLSQTKAAELERSIRTILFRWRPMSDSPEGLVADLYELIAWARDDEDPPTCPVLEG